MVWTPVSTHTFATNDALTAANSNAWISSPVANLNTAMGSFTAWTPVLTAATTNPTNYTSNGSYVLIGNLCTAWANVATGASWTAGSGAYTLSLPLAGDFSLGQQIIGVGWLNAGGSINTFAWVQQTAASACRLIYQTVLGTATAAIAHNVPAAWPVSQGNAIRCQLSYVVA